MTITQRFPSKNKEHDRFRETLSQTVAVCIKNIVLLCYAVTIGFATVLIPSVTGNDPKEVIRLNMEEVSWISPTHLISISVGCILSGPLTHAIGRKLCMKLVTIPFVIGWIIMHFSTAGWQIFLALSIIGLGCGLLEAPVMTYVAEVTQPHLRGIFSIFSTVTIFFGVLLEYTLGTFLPWRYLVLANAVIPVLSFCLLFFVPETPIWLMTKNRPEEAKESLAWLRGWTTPENVEKEFIETWVIIKKENERKETKSLFDLIRFLGKKEIYIPMGLVTFGYFLSHFSGSHTLATYAVPIFNSLNAPINGYYATIVLGVMQLLGCLFSLFFIQILGKRVLTLVSLIGVAFSFLIVSIFAYINNDLYLDLNSDFNDSNNNWIPLIFLPIASFSANLGISVIPWILIGEVFPNEDRAQASGIAGALGYIISSVSRKIFPKLVELISLPGVMLSYSSVALLGIATLYFILPETEGKTLYEISDHFSGKGKLDNKVQRKRREIEIGNEIEDC